MRNNGLRRIRDRGVRRRDGKREESLRGPFANAQGKHEGFSRRVYLISIVFYGTGTILRAMSNGKKSRGELTVGSQQFKTKKSQTQDPGSQTEHGAPAAHFSFRTQCGMEIVDRAELKRRRQIVSGPPAHPHRFQRNSRNSFGRNGGDDGTRTRGFCRDSSFMDVAHYPSSRRL
jgi:hypothetical protein